MQMSRFVAGATVVARSLLLAVLRPPTDARIRLG